MANYSKKKKWFKKFNYKGKKFDTRFKTPYKQNKATNLTKNITLSTTMTLSLKKLYYSALALSMHIPIVFFKK
jgi:hypothetical protein